MKESASPRDFVLLRGLTREKAHWGAFAELLAKQDFCRRLIALDLAGTGACWQEVCPASVRGLVAGLRQGTAAELRREPQRPRILVGLSLGAMVAYEWACQEAELFTEYVLINTSFGGLSPFYARLRPHTWRELARIILSSELRWREAGILKLVSNTLADKPSLVEHFVDIQRARPVSRPNALRQMLAAACYAPSPRQPEGLRGLVLCSSGDRMVHPGCGRKIAAALSLPCRVHPNAGHDLPLDDPHWVISELKRFLSSADAFLD